MKLLSLVWRRGVTTLLKSSHLLFLFSACFVLLSITASAQQMTQATLLGSVHDPSGAAIPNATVTITNADTGQSITVTTQPDGQYVAPSLQIGHFNVTATAQGFGSSQRTNLMLNVGDRTRVDFTLQVGSTQQTVTVEANPVAVQTDSGEVSTVISPAQVSNLPTNGRSQYTLFALTPGAQSIQGDFILPTAVSGDNNVSINGARPGQNLVMIDGGENLDRGGSQASVSPSLEAISEFRMNTSNYSAEFGIAGGATITQVIKSGTKQFHATAWWFGRNDALDARNYFNPYPQPVAELRYNLYGFNAGGPVDFWKKEHKTFFFYNMEWRSLIQGGLLNQTVPLGSEYPDAAGPGTGAILPTTFNGKPSIATVPTGVAGFGAGCPAGVLATLVPGAPFPNNTIPDCLIDPNARLLLTAGGPYGGIFPQPTTPEGQFLGGNKTPTNVREEIVRVDHQFTPRLAIFGHWISEQISQGYGTTQWSSDNVPSVSDTFNNPAYSAVVHLTQTLSSTLLNETAFAYDGNRIRITPQGLYSAPTGFANNRLFPGPNPQNRLPSIALAGSTGSNYTVNWMPWRNVANDYQLRDDVSWSHGPHQFRMGFEFMRYGKTQDWFAVTQGGYSFNGAFTGYDYADFLLGYAQQYSEDALKSTGQWNNNNYAAYIQDNWRVNRKLTLNLGLRWDYLPHTYEANHRTANFYPNAYDPALAATFDAAGNICKSATDPGCTGPSPGLGGSPEPVLAGLLFYTNGIGIGGINGVPAGLVDNSRNAFGPRIGFAYDLTGSGKTVIRGGFGIMYNRVQGNDMYNAAINPPFDASATLHNVSLSNPGLDLGTGGTITAAALPILPVNVTGIYGQNYKLPTTYQYSAGVQRAMGRAVLGVTYVGAQLRHQNYYQQVNLPPAADLPALVASKGAGINQLYNYPGFGAIRLAFNGENSHYNSLQVDVHGNVRQDLTLQAGYTLARNIDPNAGGTANGGDLNNISNPYAGWRYDLGPSAYDRTHVFFVDFVYQLPFLKNTDHKILRTTLGGWALSGIITAETGAPLNITTSGNTAASVLTYAGGVRPDVTGPITYPKTVNAWFNPASFTAPAPGTWGNLGFNAIRGPGRDNWNISLFKAFVISEQRNSRVEFRADAFNIWNHTQWRGDANNGGISTSLGSANFGAVTSAFDPREFQLGVSVYF
jgi:Carboxypeptidase regulatory-like domain